MKYLMKEISVAAAEIKLDLSINLGKIVISSKSKITDIQGGVNQCQI